MLLVTIVIHLSCVEEVRGHGGEESTFEGVTLVLCSKGREELYGNHGECDSPNTPQFWCVGGGQGEDQKERGSLLNVGWDVEERWGGEGWSGEEGRREAWLKEGYLFCRTLCV